MRREIWFKKVLWSYVPCHPMGIVVICGLVLLAQTGVFFGQRLLTVAGGGGADEWPFLLMFPTVVAGWIIAERHS